MRADVRRSVTFSQRRARISDERAGAGGPASRAQGERRREAQGHASVPNARASYRLRGGGSGGRGCVSLAQVL